MKSERQFRFWGAGNNLPVILITLMIVFTAMACSTSPDTTSYITDEEGKETFSFSEDTDGRESHFTAHFNGDRLTAIYRDGKKLEGEDFAECSELVYHKLNHLRKGIKESDDDMLHFSLDMKKFNQEMDAFREKMLHEGLASTKFHFDKQKFKEQMMKLKEELAQLKDKNFEFHFDKEKHEQAMKELQEHLADLQLQKHDFKFEFDNEEFQKAMEQLKAALQDHDWEDMEFNIPIPEIHIDMDELDESMKELEVEMGKLKSFMKEMRSEMVKDNLISSEDEDFDMEFSADEMTVNDKKVPESLHKKYKELYKKHYGKEIEDKIKIQE
ncbi:MAG: hypothetical protein IPM56_18410 [Ignavibacteriales bacterium]|nr:MAG: hypothetical protein IPM56_18410 [Ignavibacteriales bacterium]